MRRLIRVLSHGWGQGIKVTLRLALLWVTTSTVGGGEGKCGVRDNGLVHTARQRALEGDGF